MKSLRYCIRAFLLIGISLFLFSSLTLAAPSVKSDLKDYLGDVKKVEKLYLLDFQHALVDMSEETLQPRSRKELLEKNLLPKFDLLIQKWSVITPQTEAVSEIHDAYLLSYQTLREGLVLRGEAWDLEQVESNLLAAGNVTQAYEFRQQIKVAHAVASQKLLDATNQANEALDQLLYLAADNKVKVPPLYLLSTGNGRTQ